MERSSYTLWMKLIHAIRLICVNCCTGKNKVNSVEGTRYNKSASTLPTIPWRFLFQFRIYSGLASSRGLAASILNTVSISCDAINLDGFNVWTSFIVDSIEQHHTGGCISYEYCTSSTELCCSLQVTCTWQYGPVPLPSGFRALFCPR